MNETLEGVIRSDARWHLLDQQRLAYNAILADVKRLALPNFASREP